MNTSQFDDIDLQETPDQVLEKVQAAGENCSACQRAKEMVVRNPIPTIAGALIFGAAVGYLVYSRRDEIFSREPETFADAMGRKFRSGSDRISSLFHEGVGVASAKAGRASEKASEFIHDIPANEVLNSISNSLSRISNRLKFW